MKILAVCSRQYEPLRDEWFLPTLPADMEPVLVDSPFDSCPGVEFKSPAWKEAVDFKLQAICEAMRRHEGEVLCISDLDVQFFSSFREQLLAALEGCDVAGMRESAGGNMNGGFYAVRCLPRVAALWEEVSFADKTDTELYDQDGINAFLAEGAHGVTCRLLPDCFWASHRYLTFQEPEPPTIVVNHATGWMDKPAELRRMRARYGSPVGP